MCRSVCVRVHVSASAQGDQQRGLDILELESQAVVSHPKCVVLGTEPGHLQNQHAPLTAKPSLQPKDRT